MAVNFGSYDAWRGMAQSAQANRQAELNEAEAAEVKKQNAIRNAQWEKDHAEAKKNNVLARAYKQSQINEINKNLLDEKAFNDYMNKFIGVDDTVSAGKVNTTGLKSFNESLAFSPNTPDYDTNLKINTAKTEKAADVLVNIKQTFLGKTKEQIEGMLAADPNLKKELHKLKLSSGLVQGNLIDYLYSDDSVQEDTSTGSRLPNIDKDYTWANNVTTYDSGDNMSGSTITFRGDNVKGKSDTNVLLKALKMQLNNDENWNDVDNLELIQKTDALGNISYMLHEDEPGPGKWAPNWLNTDAKFEVKVDNGVARINIGTKNNPNWQNLNEVNIEKAK